MARDEVMRSGSVEAWRRLGPRGNRPNRWMRQRGRGSLRRRARDAPSGRRRGLRDGHLYGSAANVWRQRRAKRVRCNAVLDKAFFDKSAAIRGDFMTLSRPANDTAPAFSDKFGICTGRLQAIAEPAIHAWHGEPHLRSI